MQEERIAKMAENVTAGMSDEIQPTVPHIRTAAEGTDEDIALANVDQALDAILAAVKVIDTNLPEIQITSVPEEAARDAIQDLMETAIKPYLADVLKAMQLLGK